MSTTVANVEAATRDVGPGLEIDIPRLEAYLAARIAGFAGPLTVRQFKGGQSNPTYLLQTPQKNYVLRRKPPGQLLASAHAVDREFRVISALGEHTDVPVPERRAHAFALCDALAKLHRVRPEAAGLADYGKATAYLARQIARFSKQYQEDTAGGRVESMERLIEWLPRNIPQHEPPAAVVHGDYRADNVIFHPTEPRVLAILDWELSSLGDPLADFAYHLMAYRLPTLSIPTLAGRDLAALGIPAEAEYVAHYEQVAGVTIDPRDLEFYLAFGMFRLAGIFHGIRSRVVRGTAVSAQARHYAGFTDTICDVEWVQAGRADGL